MSSSKRERQRAHREAQIAAEERAKKSSKRTKVVIRWVAIAVAVVVVAFLWSLTGGDDKDSTANVEEADSIGAQTLGLDGCPPVEGSAERRFQFDTPPKLCIDTGQLYAAEFVTNVGDFTVVLDPTKDSRSVNNFIFLARHGAYNGTIFHRVIDQFVIQGGDVEGLNLSLIHI